MRVVCGWRLDVVGRFAMSAWFEYGGEVEALGAAERAMQADSEEADRLVGRLVSVYRCDFVLAEGIAFGRWALLPWDWQRGLEVPVTSKPGKPPRDMRGPVAVSLATLRWIAEGV